MKYAKAVMKSIRMAVRNPFAVLLVSLATTVSTLPFVIGVLVFGVGGGLVGLWTSSFMLGFVAVGGARIATVTLEREVSLGTHYFWEGIKRGKVMGPVIGLGSFIFSLLAVGLTTIPVNGIAGMSLILISIYILLGWYLLAMYALTLWASFTNSREIRSSFTEGGKLIFEQPVAAAWLLVQTIGWSLLFIPLLIAPMLLLPGFIQMIGTTIVVLAINESDSASHRPNSDSEPSLLS